MEHLLETLSDYVTDLTASYNDGAENDELLITITKIEGTIAELKEELGG